MQLSGSGYFDADDVCNAAAMGADFSLILEGDLDGCLYTFVDGGFGTCMPSGVYYETGTEIFVGRNKDGEEGAFGTTYRFTAKYTDCPNLEGQIFGRCQHPIVADSGSGGFAGFSGRLDFRDDVEAFEFPYRGHLKW